MKKVFSLITACILLLAGCGSTTTDADVSIDSERVQEANLDVWLPAGKNTDYFKDGLDSYNNEYGTNITVTFTDVAPSDIVAKATPMISAKQEMPELMIVQDLNFMDLYSNFPDEFVNLTEYGLNDEYWSNYAPKKLEMMKNMSGGDLYGFPTDFAPTMVFYRDDLFKKVGIDYEKDINSMKDLLDAGVKIYEETGVKMLGLSAPADSTFFSTMLQMQDLTFYSDNKWNFDTLEAKKAAEYTVAAAQNKATSQYVTADLAGTTKQSSSFTIQGSWWGGTNKRDNPDQSGKWKVGALPPFEEGMEAVTPVNGGSAMYVSKHSDETQAALQVATYIYGNPDVAGKAIEYGISTANIGAYDTEYGQVEDEYYSNQKVSQMYASTFDIIGTNVNYELSTAKINKIVGAELGKVADGSQSLDEGLDAIARQCDQTVEIPE